MALSKTEDIISLFSNQDALPEEFKILLRILNLEVNIEYEAGKGAVYNSGNTTLTIPTQSGPGILPMNSQFGYITFHQYDYESGAIHELGHAVIDELGISNSEIEELNNAILAAATREVIQTIKRESYTTEKEYVDDFKDALRLILTGFDDEEKWTPEYKLQIARTPDASFENAFNLNRDLFEVSGLSGNDFLYRTGYATHEDVGVNAEWTTFAAGTAKGIVAGNGLTLINNAEEGEEGIAWLGNQYDNSLETGNANDYIDGGHGSDTLDGKN